jgi:hypothetical protein
MRLAYIFISNKHTTAVQLKNCPERRVCWGSTLSSAISGHTVHPLSTVRLLLHTYEFKTYKDGVARVEWFLTNFVA